MSNQQTFKIILYLDGTVMDNVLHGVVEYLQAKTFLNTAANVTYRLEQLPRPTPDPGQDYYELSPQQFSAYQAFLDRLRGKAPRPK